MFKKHENKHENKCIHKDQPLPAFNTEILIAKLVQTKKG
jgi:hypothetical protein